MQDFICSSCGNSFSAEPDQQGQIVCTICGMFQSADTAERPLAAGTRVGGYEIIRHIAAGGSGSVYLAEQLTMKRKVALKILNRKQVSPEEAERFLEEARNAAKFEHPHVVSVIDSGISPEGCCYFAMQYVEGETLEEILNRGQTFPEDEALVIVLMVADALRSVWNKYKMFHKDIKPGNIILTPEKKAMLLDMGIAQERGESKLADGSIEGSPYYMSPEQARGEELTWSSDLYSLGATLYQMVTGKYLYDSEDVEDILRQHDSAPFPDPAVRVPEKKISAGMTQLLRRMLEKQAANRYSSWDEFIEKAETALETILPKEDTAVSGTTLKQYMQLNARPDRPVKKIRPAPSPLIFICNMLLIFVLSAMLLGGVILYLAVHKNSNNARALLRELDRKQSDSLARDPDEMDRVLEKAAPYFNRFGVLPSIRREFQNCREKAAKLREKLSREEKDIIKLESRTAECLQTVDRELQEAKKQESQNQALPAFHHLLQAQNELSGMTETVRKTNFLLHSHAERSRQLIKRLNTAQDLVNRERRLCQKKFGPPHFRRRGNQPQPPVRPASGEKKAPAAKTPAPSPEKTVPVQAAESLSQENARRYQQVLEREKNRIRTELLLQSIPDKIRPENPVWKPRFKRQPFPELNREFDQWKSRMKQMISRAAVIWNAVYDTHQELAGFYFTVPTPEGKIVMELRTILRDEMTLFRQGMPNVKKTFAQLYPMEWMDFIRDTAKKKKLLPDLESYCLADGWFFAVKRSADPFIRKEAPLMQEVIYRYLTGEKISGVQQRSEKEIAALIRKHQIDPSFAHFRAKKNNNRTRQQSAKATQGGAE